MTICRHCKQHITPKHNYWIPDQGMNTPLPIHGGDWGGALSHRICSERGHEDGVHEPMSETEIVEQLIREYGTEI